MTINERVMTALSAVGPPVAFQHYTGSAEQYITFFTYLEQPEQHADDEETVTGHYVQVDLWSRQDYTETVAALHQQMVLAGFRRKNMADLYEKDLKVYHKVLRYVWEQKE